MLLLPCESHKRLECGVVRQYLQCQFILGERFHCPAKCFVAFAEHKVSGGILREGFRSLQTQFNCVLRVSLGKGSRCVARKEWGYVRRFGHCDTRGRKFVPTVNVSCIDQQICGAADHACGTTNILLPESSCNKGVLNRENGGERKTKQEQQLEWNSSKFQEINR